MPRRRIKSSLGGGFLALIVWVILEMTKLIKNPSEYLGVDFRKPRVRKAERDEGVEPDDSRRD